MISNDVYKYCGDDVSLIENYDEAIADSTQTWHCHHRAEILPCGAYTTNDLMKFGLYFNRPASELIFLTNHQHTSLHSKNRVVSDVTRKKISEANKRLHLGTKLLEEHKRKISEGLKGHTCSNYTKQKISSSKKGMTLSQQWRDNLSEYHSGEKNQWFGMHWYTNGKVSKRFFETDVPEGFHRGRHSRKS